MSTQPNLVSRSLPIRVHRVCVALVGSDPAEMIDKAEALVRENPFFEFRLDYLRDPNAAMPKLKRFFEMHPEAICIATCRRAASGGKFKGSAALQHSVLMKAASIGFQFVDVEVQSAQAWKAAEYEKLRMAAGVVLSFHDFERTRNLDATFEEMTKFPADYYKVVSTATCLYDNVVMMKLLEQKSHNYSVVGMCMGEQGIVSRVLGLRAGSAFTFAAATAGEETGPGQVAFRTLHDIYRIEYVDAATRVYGVAGDPVAQSLSPMMMNSAFRRENVNAVFLALHAKKLDDLIACLRDIPIHGISVTMPYKQEIVSKLSGSDELTKKTGSCNTVVRGQDGRLFGFNTDVYGVVGPLEQRLSLAGAKVLVIGAGGAARAAVFGLRDRGADVSIVNRTPANGQKLAREASVKYVKHQDLKKLRFDVIINATPAGMGSDRSSPLSADEINTKYLLEMVYTNPETPLVQLAKAKGVIIIPGTEMFVAQGARQFEIWTGKPAPVAEMRHVVSLMLQARSAAAVVIGPAKKPQQPAREQTERPAKAAPRKTPKVSVPAKKVAKRPVNGKPSAKRAAVTSKVKKAAVPAKKSAHR